MYSLKKFFVGLCLLGATGCGSLPHATYPPASPTGKATQPTSPADPAIAAQPTQPAQPAPNTPAAPPARPLNQGKSLSEVLFPKRHPEAQASQAQPAPQQSIQQETAASATIAPAKNKLKGARASMILGIIGLAGWVVSGPLALGVALAAVIVGGISLIRMAAKPGVYSNKHQAIIGLVLGLLGILIPAALVLSIAF